VVAQAAALGLLQRQIILAGQQLKVIVMEPQVLVMQAVMECYRQTLIHLVVVAALVAQAKHLLLSHQPLEMAGLEKKALLQVHRFFMQAAAAEEKVQPRMAAQVAQAAEEMQAQPVEPIVVEVAAASL